METVRDYIFLGSKITADGDFSREIKKSYDQPSQHIKKQRHYFGDQGLLAKTMGFPVDMYGYESRTIKKAEC